MNSYYIKYIWGPAGQQGCPDYNNNVVTFAEGAEKQCERFRNCDGFLLYETGSGNKNLRGAKTIYAWGIIDSDQGNLNIKKDVGAGGKRWTCGVRVNLKNRINPRDGVALSEIKGITGVRNMQRRGGLLSITEGQFKTLRKTLEMLEK